MSKISKKLDSIKKMVFNDKKEDSKKSKSDWNLDERSSEKGYTRYAESYWDKKYYGKSYSNYFFEDSLSLEDKDLIRKGYSMAASFVKALVPDKKINIFNVKDIENETGENIKTNGLKISNKIFENKEIDSSEKMDIFIGEAIHECCHLIYTDNKIRLPENVIIRSIFNVIEDERVESELSQEYAGYINYIAKSKKYFYEIAFAEKLKKIGIKEMNNSQKMLMAVYHLIRYPKNLTEQDETNYKTLLLKSKKILTPFPKTTKDSVTCARKIYEILKEFNKTFEEEMKESVMKDMLASMADKSKAGKAGGTSKSSEAMPQLPDMSKLNKGEKEKLMQKMLKEMMSNLEKSSTEKMNNKSKSEKKEIFNGKNSSEIIDESKLNKPTKEFYKELMRQFLENAKGKDFDEKTEKLANEFNSLMDVGSASDSKKVTENCNSFGDGNIRNKFTSEIYKDYGGGIGGENKNTLFLKMPENVATYQKLKEKVSPYSSTLSKILRFRSVDKKLVNKSTRNGYLDTNKLAEARQGIPTVYERYGHAKSDKIAVCLLIDESGSMGGSKIKHAAESAVLLAEALKKNKDIELFVYGHTADVLYDNSTDMRIYKEPNYEKINSMGHIGKELLYENADGYAIYETAKRVRKFTTRPCVMFVISDGAPNCSAYRSDSGISHTRKMVTKITKEENMQVIQIAIESGIESKDMFDHFVEFTDLAKLPSDIGKLVKKVITKMMKIDLVNY